MAKRVCEWKGKRRAAHRGVQVGVLSPSVDLRRRNARSRSLLVLTPKNKFHTGPAEHDIAVKYATRTRPHVHIRSQRTRFTQDGDKAFEFTTQPRTLGRTAAGRTVRPCGRGQTRATQTKTGTTGRTPHTILTPHLRRQKFSRSSRGKPLRAPRLRARGRVQ